MIRRHLLSLVPVLLLGGLCAPAHGADEHLSDVRTARSVALEIPRTTLRQAVQALSEGTEVPLSVAPGLTELPLTGYLPNRPLREIMGALATLFDAAWAVQPGNPAGYRLEPDPVAAKASVAARESLLKKLRKDWDDASADVSRKIQSGMLTPAGRSQQVQVFANLIWNLAPPADRDRVLSGATVTFPIAEAQARPIYELMLALSSKAVQPLKGPLMATIDIEDRADTAFPLLRTRATARRENSILSIITASLEFPSQPVKKEDPLVAGFAEDYEFATGVGENGRFNGTRDEILMQVAKTANAPVLSRHRAYGASAGIGGGGRKLSQVIEDLATVSDAVASSTPRGFHLIRSRTEPLDTLGLAPRERLQAFVSRLPATGKAVPLETIIELAPLTSLQLSVLHRSNVALEPIGFARETYALIRFYHALKPEQRTALFTKEGLDAASLSHLQLHLLLDQRDKRGDFDIYEHLQEIRGLRFRFMPENDEDGEGLTLQLFRGDTLVSTQSLDLPIYEPEPRPTAVK